MSKGVRNACANKINFQNILTVFPVFISRVYCLVRSSTRPVTYGSASRPTLVFNLISCPSFLLNSPLRMCSECFLYRC